MNGEEEFDLAAFDSFKPFTTVKIGGRDWPLFHMTHDDFKDAGLIELMAEAAEKGVMDMAVIVKKSSDRMNTILWVILRKGAPGMTPQKMWKGQWTLTAEEMGRLVPFFEGGRPLIVTLLTEMDIFGVGGGGSSTNPSPGSPSSDQQDGEAPPQAQ